MSYLSGQIAMLDALGRAFHVVAEKRIDRPGKVAPLAEFPDETAARVLGSIAQACEAASLELSERAENLARCVDDLVPVVRCPACKMIVGQQHQIDGRATCPRCVEVFDLGGK